MPQGPLISSSDGLSATAVPWAVRALNVASCLACLSLYLPWTGAPLLIQDDFQFLEASWTWQRTKASLWAPHNEHFMPPGRVLTWALVQAAGRPTALPWACGLLGPVALVAGALLVYLFVRRELGHPLYGIVAMTLFGVTCVYQQAVWWFAASFAILALDTLLVALLAAQRWRQQGGRLYLILAALACAIAPMWFASGVLAGPLCSLYLLPRKGQRRCARAWLAAALPAVATGLFLAATAPLLARHIPALEHYQDPDRPSPLTRLLLGAEATERSLVDNLLLGSLGVGGLPAPLLSRPATFAVFAVVVWFAARWWRQARQHRLLLVGIATLLASYLLTYSARADFVYEKHMTRLEWSRYHLLPQLGLALFVAGGLPGKEGRWFCLPGSGVLSLAQVKALAALMVICWAIQLPRAVLSHPVQTPDQAELLRRMEAVDARCREHHISADEALAALGKLDLGAYASSVDGWAFLRGSDDPWPHAPDEVRRLLAP